MSHILDALQKVQEEKTAKLKQTTITGGALLDAPTAQKPRRSRFLLVGGTVAFLLIVAVIVQNYLKPAHRSQTDLSAPAPPLSQPQPLQPATAPAPAPQAVTDAQQPTAAPITTAALPPAPAPPVAASAATATALQAEHEEDQDTRADRRRRQQHTAAATPAASTAAAPGRVVQTSTPEGIKLTGIAWQENRKMRRAVVNDILAGEGTVIAGAQIVEIRPQAVRFEKNGTLYEVTLAR